MIEAFAFGLFIGIAIGAVAADVLFAQPARLELDRLRWHRARRRRIDAEDRLGQAVYLSPGQIAINDYRNKVGLRVVGGEQMYSADWLNDR